MQLTMTTEDLEFGPEVRTFLAQQLDPAVSRKVRLGYPIASSEQDAWTHTLNARCWVAPNWPQAGISFLLIDMRSPGISVRPLRAFNGKQQWNQVCFDAVRVPKVNRLGDEHGREPGRSRLL